MSVRALFVAAIACVVGLLAQPLRAAPGVSSVDLRGLQIGGTTTLTLQGFELGADARLIAPFAMAKQEVLAGATAQKTQLAVTLDGSVSPGIYAVRVATATGITPPLMLGVDRLPQAALADNIASLPIAFSGALGGGQIIKSTFTGTKGQPIVVDVEALRLGANFKPVVRLYDSRGKQLAFSQPRHSLAGDARIALTLPADDTYTIELHDLLYRAAGPGFFRLKVGELTYADFAIPQAIAKGTKSPVQFASTNVASGATVEVDASQAPFSSPLPGAAPAAALFTGAAPDLVVSEAAESVEAPVIDGQKQTLSAVPCGVTGAIGARGEEDQYLVPVTAGQKLRIDVSARRIGSLLDGVLVVRGLAGNELARNDDQAGTADPGLDFTVPANVDKVLVCVRDMQNRFGAEHVYHLSIRDAAAPDLTAVAAVDTINVAVGSTVLIPVTVQAKNYSGPIRLELQGAVGDVQVAGADLPAGASVALMTLSARGGQPVHGVVQIIARATDPNVSLARYVVGPDSSGATRHQPHLRRDFGFAVAGEAPLGVALKTAVEAPKAFQGARYPVPLTISRREGVTGDIRLRLVTTQPPLKKKVKEKNQDKEVDDTDRMLRLVDGMTIKPDQSEFTAMLHVPADLPLEPWSTVLVAELLSPDGKNVVGTTSTSTLTITPEPAFKLELTGSPQAEGRAGVGPAGQFTGKITRSAGFNQPVVVTLQGFPPPVKKIPQVTIAADQTDFTLPLTFEYGSREGDYKKVKLLASVEGSALPGGTADVEVKIVPGEKPQ